MIFLTSNEREATKVHGQPTNQDLNLLEDELLWISSLIYSKLGGGAHGHAGLLLSDVNYGYYLAGGRYKDRVIAKSCVLLTTSSLLQDVVLDVKIVIYGAR